MSTVLTIAVLMAAAAPGQDLRAPSLTLHAAVERARRHNARVLDAADQVTQARLHQRGADRAFRPRFQPRITGALGGGELANQSYGAELSQRFPWGTEVQAAISAASARNQLGTFYYSDTTISITQPIYRGGLDPQKEQKAASITAVERADADRLTVENAVAVDVAAAYYQVVAQEHVIRVAEKALERYRHLLAVSEAKLEIGKVSQLDVLRARRLVRDAEGRVADAHTMAEDARDDLRMLIGDPDLGAFTVSVDLPPASAVPSSILVSATVPPAPEVRRARDALAAAQRRARSAGSPLLPRIDLSLALTRRETGADLRSSFGTDRFHVVPLVQLSLPVGGDAAGAELARVAVVRRQRELEAAEAKAAIELRRAIRARDRLVRQLAEAEAGVSFAVEEAAVARARFENGLSNNLDLVAAEADLLAAESRRISAAASVAVATLRLKATFGVLNVAEDFAR